MKEITFDNGKDLITFYVDGTEVKIFSSNTEGVFVANAKTFHMEMKSQKNLLILRRSKGEKFYQQWLDDLNKFTKFSTEKEVVDDIMEDFHKKRGWRIVNK